MTPNLNTAALAMRSRVRRRKHVERALKSLYHALAVFGVGFLFALVVGFL